MANELRYTLDTSTINYICRKCKQDDDRTLVLTLFDKNIPFPITGATLVLKAQRSNGTFVIQDTGLSISNNVVTISMVRDITRIAGQVKLELKITLESKDISTFTFMLDVVPSVIGDGDTKSANVMTALEDLDITIASAISTNTTLNTLNTTALGTNTTLNTTNTTALGTKSALNTLNTTALGTNTTLNTTNTALNTLNTTANATNTALNTLNTTANATKTALNTLNTTANVTKTALEVAIANGDTAAMKAKLDGIQPLLNAKVNKWNELEYTNLQHIPPNLVEATISFGQTNNTNVLGSLSHSTRFTFAEAGKYLFVIDAIVLVPLGKTASVSLHIDGIRECRGVGTNALNIDGGNSTNINFSAFKSIDVGGFVELRAVHNNTDETYLGSCKVRIIKLIE